LLAVTASLAVSDTGGSRHASFWSFEMSPVSYTKKSICLDSNETLCSWQVHPGMSAPPSDVKLALQRTSSTLLQQIEAGHSHGKNF